MAIMDKKEFMKKLSDGDLKKVDGGEWNGCSISEEEYDELMTLYVAYGKTADNSPEEAAAMEAMEAFGRRMDAKYGPNPEGKDVYDIAFWAYYGL